MLHAQNFPTIALGYSGGTDSEVLAFLLAKLKSDQPQLDIRLIHINHRISPNADDWAKLCQSRAASYQLPYFESTIEVSKGARQSKEALAREMRYQQIHQFLDKPSLLLTAHHQDDQIETFMLALKRGSGPNGLKSIVSYQSFADEHGLYRPLLDWSREKIVEFANCHDIPTISDETNFDLDIDRNFIRHKVRPLLTERWPQFGKTLSRSAGLIHQEQQLLQELLIDKLALLCDEQGLLDVSLWQQQSSSLQGQLLRTYIAKFANLMPSLSQLKQMQQQLTAKEDAKVCVSWASWQLRRFKSKVYIIKPSAVPQRQQLPKLPEQLDVNGQGWLLQSLDDGERLRKPNTDEVITIEYGLPSSTLCCPSFRDKSRPLKKLWQELNVPPWQREQVPMLCYNGQLVAALGYWLDKRYLTQSEDGFYPTLISSAR
ncbi:tRNA lysidine(34) synthetase TilS [Paraferrimonas sp. SM1919]|uniref:tRNA lysidine(34) synthetase TilS n=1 Tax=Paraferrimonas sp. SM1919 TaxID=2662263 RepID=UPI001969B905|nr:tRNA lysidine(34) synthetase TilS [Paraferrimonas sp. SM1919]